FLPRHGRGHRVTPSELNFRANIWGLKFLGAQWVISISAVGSMKEAIRPLDLVVPDQFFDATRRRVSSFFGDGIVAHVGMAEAVVQNLLKNVATAKDVLRRVIPVIGPPRTCECASLLKDAVITNPKAFPPATRKKLGLLLDPYFPRGRNPFPRGRNRVPRERSRRAPASGHPRSKPASRSPLQ